MKCTYNGGKISYDQHISQRRRIFQDKQEILERGSRKEDRVPERLRNSDVENGVLLEEDRSAVKKRRNRFGKMPRIE
jgi:hypothetical protein